MCSLSLWEKKRKRKIADILKALEGHNPQTFPRVGMNRCVTESITEEIMSQLRSEIGVRQSTEND